MALFGPTTTNVRLLATQAREPGQQPTKCRFLVDDQYIKYAEIGPGVFEPDDWDLHPETKFAQAFPPFPTGNDWNYCRIQRTLDGRTAGIAWLDNRYVGFSGRGKLWCKTKLKLAELTEVARLSAHEDRLSLVSHPSLEKNALMKITQFPADPDELQKLETETLAYKKLAGTNVTPAFRGHVMEGSRAVGFLLEWIEGARVPGRGYLGACLSILGNMYGAGVVLPDPRPDNFLLKEDGSIVAVSLGGAKMGSDATSKAFEESYKTLMDVVHAMPA